MIIGLSGLAGAGKSEVAKILREVGGFERVAFAAPLKDMLAAVGFTHDQLWGSDKEREIPEFGCSARHFMQTLGTDWGRAMIHPEIWVKMWGRKVDFMGPNAPIVVDDVRFPNEVAAIKARGGVVWRIHRSGLAAGTHASETHSLDVDSVIVNDASLTFLREAVEHAHAYATGK